jgi:hypothetical protein
MPIYIDPSCLGMTESWLDCMGVLQRQSSKKHVLFNFSFDKLVGFKLHSFSVIHIKHIGKLD